MWLSQGIAKLLTCSLKKKKKNTHTQYFYTIVTYGTPNPHKTRSSKGAVYLKVLKPLLHSSQIPKNQHIGHRSLFKNASLIGVCESLCPCLASKGPLGSIWQGMMDPYLLCLVMAQAGPTTCGQQPLHARESSMHWYVHALVDACVRHANTTANVHLLICKRSWTKFRGKHFSCGFHPGHLPICENFSTNLGLLNLLA